MMRDYLVGCVALVVALATGFPAFGMLWAGTSAIWETVFESDPDIVSTSDMARFVFGLGSLFAGGIMLTVCHHATVSIR